jgi:hypothetical protein
VKRDFFARSNAKAWTVAAVTAAFFVPLGVFGAPALARSAASASQYEYAGSSQYQYKVTICHRTHSKKASHQWRTISVGAPAVKAHLRHGDKLGPCPPVAPVTTSANPGKSGGDHGKSGDHGNGQGKGHGK